MDQGKSGGPIEKSLSNLFIECCELGYHTSFWDDDHIFIVVFSDCIDNVHVEAIQPVCDLISLVYGGRKVKLQWLLPSDDPRGTST